MESIDKGFIEENPGSYPITFSFIYTVTLRQLLKIDDCAKNDPSYYFLTANVIAMGLKWIWARICKRLWSPGIDSEESMLLAYVAWRAGTTNRIVVPVLQAGNRFLGSLKGLKNTGSGHILNNFRGWRMEDSWRTRDFPLHINPSCMILNIFYDHWSSLRARAIKWSILLTESSWREGVSGTHKE